MKNVYKVACYMLISLIVFSITGCSKAANTHSQSTKKVNAIQAKTSQSQTVVSQNDKENQSNTGNATQVTPPKNQPIISLSPDGKYRAEAYGTNNEVTAGGLFLYEGIHVLNASNNDVIWKMEPGGFTADFSWSPDSSYVGIYYEGRIWGESTIVDIKSKKSISLPTLDKIASHYGESVKPQENRPDPYFKVSGWKDSQTVIVSFHWAKKAGDNFNGEYTFNIKTNSVVYK